jgi:glucokinase
MQRVLAADLGGTNARFAIAEVGAESVRLVFERDYETGAFPSFEPALDAFLREAPDPAPSRGALALAGAVEPERSTLLNRPTWRIERKALAARGVDAVLLNDFEALAHGVAHCGAGDWIELQAGKPGAAGNRALVGAGTGLGVAALVWDGARYCPLPSEAGHMAFAPRDETQMELWRALHARHGRVSAERVISGPGLAAIHGFLERSQEMKDPELITTQALKDPNGVEAKTLALFVSCYGAFAGDIALTYLAKGGVYICGGIAAKLAPRLQQPDFLAAFNDKGRHAGLARSMPVRVVLNEKLGLLGAAWAGTGR